MLRIQPHSSGMARMGCCIVLTGLLALPAAAAAAVTDSIDFSPLLSHWHCR